MPEEYDEDSGDPRPRHQHLAARRGARRRPDRAAPLDDRLRQLPAAGGAADRAAQRDRDGAGGQRRRRGPRLRSSDSEPGKPPAQVMAQSGLSSGAETIIAKAHHGSVSKEQRALIEDDLKRGRLPAVVATSSLELGIDMGAVDLVIQIESPPSVASALQRVGRAGHQVGEVSRGVLFPKHRGDLAQTAVAVAADAQRRDREALRPHQPARRPGPAGRGRRGAWRTGRSTSSSTSSRRAASYTAAPPQRPSTRPSTCSAAATPARSSPSCDRASCGTASPARLSGRPGAQRLAVTSGGTIPDRGLFGVFLVGEKASRVGELDEEMVYESRVGDIFALGATSWRIEDITHDRVLVTPAPGIPGRLPFWKGDTLGRPAELGRGDRRLHPRARPRHPRQGLASAPASAGLDAVRRRQPRHLRHRAARGDQRGAQRHPDRWWSGSATSSATGASSSTPPTARPCTRPGRWPSTPGCASATTSTARRSPPTTASSSGSPTPRTSRRAVTSIVFEPDEIEQLVTQEVGGSALFASRFRECAARALLLPRRDPGRRSPLWQQRQRSAQLLEVASQYPSFPIVLEADPRVPPGRLRPARAGRAAGPDRASRGHRRRRRHARRRAPTPAACSSATSPSSSTRATPRSPSAGPPRCRLDQGLLAELLGRAELRELLDPEVLAEVEAELQWLAPDRRARDAEAVADLLRLLGPLSHRARSPRGRPTAPTSAPG